VRLRRRDVRAIAFCAVTTCLVAVVMFLLTHNSWASLALTGAYALFLLSRPRVRRVVGRLQERPTWDGYHWD
jgi:hypothetical protein